MGWRGGVGSCGSAVTGNTLSVLLMQLPQGGAAASFTSVRLSWFVSTHTQTGSFISLKADLQNKYLGYNYILWDPRDPARGKFERFEDGWKYI